MLGGAEENLRKSVRIAGLLAKAQTEYLSKYKYRVLLL
jgi:hypothetical protein